MGNELSVASGKASPCRLHSLRFSGRLLLNISSDSTDTFDAYDP